MCGLVCWYPCVGSMATSRIAADYLNCTNRCIHVICGWGCAGAEFFKIFDLALRVICFMHCLRQTLHVCHVLGCYTCVIDACLYCTLMPSDVTVNVDLPSSQGYLQRT